MRVRAAVVVVLAARVATAEAQPAPTPATRAAPAPVERRSPALTAAAIVFGGLAGLGLAVAIVHPKTGIVSNEYDGEMTVLAGLTGVALGVLVDVTADGPHRGRLRATGGSSTTHRWEYALSYRTPVARWLAVEGLVLLASDSWEQTELQRNCGLFGCLTLNYLVDARYEQLGSIMARVAFEPLPDSRFVPTLAIGAGPSRIHVDWLHDAEEVRTGALFDATLSFEPGGMTAEIGVRYGVMDTVTTHETAGYFRLGYTWGKP